MLDLETERKKALDLLAGKAGVEIEIVRDTVRTELKVTEGIKEWPKKKEEEQKETPLQRIEQYRRKVKE